MAKGEGMSIKDFLGADRIVIGIDDIRAEAALRKVYQPLTQAGIPLLATGTINAELIRYAANALLAKAMRGQTLLDFRNIISADHAARAGLHHHGVGRGMSKPSPARRGQGAAADLRVAASPA